MRLKLKNFFVFAVAISFIFVCFPRIQAATWSSPVDLEFMPPTTTINGNQNYSGNTIITWLDIPSNNFLASYYLVGASSWSPPQVVVSAAIVVNPPAMAISSSGIAVSTWIQTGPGPSQTIQSAQLIGDTWVSLGTVGSPAVISFTQNSVDVDPEGNILTTYTQDNGDTTNTLFAATHSTSGWTSPQVLFTSGLGETIQQLVPTLLDNNGNGHIIWVVGDGVNFTVYASTYDKASGTFSSPTTIFSGPGTVSNLYAGLSPSGNTVLTWVVNNTDLYGSVFTPSTGWSSATLLLSQPNVNSILASVNDAGNAVITNNATANTYIYVSTYSNGMWSTELVVTALPGCAVDNPIIALDAFGNTLLIWTSCNPINNKMTFLYSTRNGLQGPWSAPAMIPFTMMIGTVEAPVRVVITPSEQVVFAFLVVAPPFFTDVEIILGDDVFPPQPVTNISGKVIKNRFLTETDIIHRLTWEASPSPNVTSYNIYRNGVLIAQVSAQDPLVYDDHNRSKRKVDTYTIVAISNGIPSTSTTIRIP